MYSSGFLLLPLTLLLATAVSCTTAAAVCPQGNVTFAQIEDRVRDGICVEASLFAARSFEREIPDSDVRFKSCSVSEFSAYSQLISVGINLLSSNRSCRGIVVTRQLLTPRDVSSRAVLTLLSGGNCAQPSQTPEEEVQALELCVRSPTADQGRKDECLVRMCKAAGAISIAKQGWDSRATRVKDCQVGADGTVTQLILSRRSDGATEEVTVRVREEARVDC